MNKKLKMLRIEKEYTQDDLARKSGVSRASIVQIERGKQLPCLETAKKIAKALDTTVEKIF